MKKADYDLYKDYLLSAFGAATATGLSAMVDGEVSHDQVTFCANLARSPTKTLCTQSNHIFMVLCAMFKLECLSLQRKLNPFALCKKRLINATQAAFEELQNVRACVTSDIKFVCEHEHEKYTAKP